MELNDIVGYAMDGGISAAAFLILREVKALVLDLKSALLGITERLELIDRRVSSIPHRKSNRHMRGAAA